MTGITTKYRSNAPEIMDDFDMEGTELIDALDKIARVNRILGGNRITIQGVSELIANVPESQPVYIVDIGCGNGDMLRALADYAAEKGRDFQLAGIDANAFTIAHAEKLSLHYNNIEYRCVNIFDEAIDFGCDIVLLTLTLHHFTDNEIIAVLARCKDQSRIGIVINDLHRSTAAYRLFALFGILYGLKNMPKKDGLTSILRGFKRNELQQFSKELQFKKYSIRWKWAFRYQWIISNL